MPNFHLRQRISAFRQDRQGTIAITFALTLVTGILFIGAAVDYSHALTERTQLQAALDSAVLAAATQPAAARANAAMSAFNANTQSAGLTGATASFQAGTTTYSGTASVTMPTSFMAVASISSVAIGAAAAATYATTTGAGACIVALGIGQAANNSAFTLNGAPNMALTGCGVTSNASMTCNGHDGGSLASTAVGTVSGCSNPIPSSPAWGDPYASLASNITKLCSGVGAGVTWTPGALPSGSNFITVAKTGYTEYHVCGNLTLSGSGSLVSGGAVIVVENGSINASGGAAVTATNTTFVLAGANSSNHYVTFPNGRGQLATLTVQAPTSAANPWRGIAMYVDPALTANIDDDFGPGASLAFDGVVYMPHTNLTFHGNTQSSTGQCSTLVVNSFTSNGSGSITFSQSTSACLSAGVATQVNARLTL